MPTLRNNKSYKLDNPVNNAKGDCTFREPTPNPKNLSKKFQQLISSISSSDIKQSLRSSPSEAKFYSRICEEELKKLLAQRQILDKRITAEDEYIKKKKNEASSIISKLLDVTDKKIRDVKHRSKLQKDVGVKPTEVKRVFNEAKKISEILQSKREKLLFQRHKLNRQIRMAKNTVEFCKKFMNQKRPV